MVGRGTGFTADYTTGLMPRTVLLLSRMVRDELVAILRPVLLLPRMMTARSRRAGRYITSCAVVAASGFNEVADFGICRRSLSA